MCALPNAPHNYLEIIDALQVFCLEVSGFAGTWRECDFNKKLIQVAPMTSLERRRRRAVLLSV
jgi:hypothetical protein